MAVKVKRRHAHDAVLLNACDSCTETFEDSVMA